MHFQTISLLVIIGIATTLTCSLNLSGRRTDRIIFPDDATTTTTTAERHNGINELTTDSVAGKSSVGTKDPVTPATLENRIALDTLPKCTPGFDVKAGRCRKSA